ncbi:MAG: glutamine cyclotransferase [Acidobacteria bacterium 13_1_40CM_3_65_5]|nr:MAG: glutamine cyclotransferase [Acidobacteria bacterium 13_1_40CM_3_65_5]
MRLLLAAMAAALMFVPQVPNGTNLPVFGYQLVRAYPHDPTAFTQGLQYVDGIFYEGTGLNGRSSIRKVKLETGEVLEKRDVPAQYFGEGITVWKSDLIELTWQSEIAFVYDKTTLQPRRTLKYVGEGWGLTHDGVNLIMSDGSDRLRLLDPTTFAERRRILVTDGGFPVRSLNELEFVKGEILANIWQTDYIARIAPDGHVIGWIDLSGLLSPSERGTVEASGGVLNGIAYDEAKDRLFVTGKLWPKLFEIKIVPKR